MSEPGFVDREFVDRQFVGCELFVGGREQTRLVVNGREYAGRPRLDEELERRLRELALRPVDYGTALFEALFAPSGSPHRAGDTLDGYRDALALASHGGLPLRFRLHVAAGAPASLHALYWELLYDPVRGVALARSQDTAFSRFLGVPFDPATGLDGAARLLVVLPNPSDLADYGLPMLDEATQRDALQQLLGDAFGPSRPGASRTGPSGTVSWEFLEPPITLSRIRERLLEETFHAVHVQTHGVLPEGETTSRLVLENEDRQAEFLTEDLVAQLFAGRRELRLLNLTACHGGVPSTKDPFSGLAPSLVRRGMPAVVAMGRALSLEAANRFNGVFYRRLAQNGYFDLAVNEARLHMFLAEPESLDWSIPNLFMRSGDGALWRGAHPSAESSPGGVTLKTLLACRWSTSSTETELLGTVEAALGRILERHRGRQAAAVDEEESSVLAYFDRPVDAVSCALDLHRLASEELPELGCAAGIHLGEVGSVISGTTQPGSTEPGSTEEVARRLAAVALPRQTLLSEAAFDLARRGMSGSGDGGLTWTTHGDYRFDGLSFPLSVHEVAPAGTAARPLLDGPAVQRVSGDPTIVGWRPGVGLDIPGRPHWVLEDKLSKGGFGEVWSARHAKLGELRAFKFCFETEHLRALQREITLFRLLKEELGGRSDIARILDWNFEQAPYFIESELADGGDWTVWAAGQGGLGAVPMETRLELVAQVATALAAAHSVGVLHQDVKPANVLVTERSVTEQGSRPRALLADFGIGSATEKSRFDAAGITVAGLTTDDAGSSQTGTRLYMAPELLEGKRGTVQSDIYALGVMLYQVVVGNFSKALAPGWQRDVDDELLREDIAAAVDGSPERRLGNALRLAERLRTLDARRRQRREEEQRRAAARQATEALERAHERRRRLVWVIGILSVATLVLLYLLHRLDEERGLALEAQAAAEQSDATTRKTLDTMVDLFKFADPDKAQGREVTVVEALSRGAEQVRSDAELPVQIRGELLATFGEIFDGLGAYEDSIRALEDAVEIRRGEDPKVLADSLHDLALAHRRLGHYEVAEPHYREAVEILEKDLGPEAFELVEPLRGLAVMRILQGQADAAEPDLERAWSLVEARDPDGEQAAKTSGAMGQLRLVQGQLDEAFSFYERSLLIFRKVEGPFSMRGATAIDNLGRVRYRQKRFDEAAVHFREALEIRRRLLGAEHPDVVKSLGSLAAAHQATQRYDEAERLYLEALAVEVEHFGQVHIRVGDTYFNLGSLYARQGRREDAARYFRQAAEIFELALGPEHAKTVRARAQAGALP